MSAVPISTMIAQEPMSMRRGLVQAFVGASMIMPLLNFVAVDGFDYSYGEQSTLGSIAFRALNGSYDSSAGIVNPKKEVLSIFGGIVSMDHTLEGSATHANALSAKMKAAGLFFDYNFINGDQTNDPKQFFGLKNRILAAQIVYAGDNGAALTLAMLDQLLDKVVGPNNTKIILMSKYQKRKFKALVLAAAGGASVADVTGDASTYDGARIVVLDEDDVPSTVLPQTETRGSSDVTGSIYCIRPGTDPEGEFVQGLARKGLINSKQLAQVNTTISDLVEMFGGFGIFHGRAAARLAGLT